MGQTRLNSLVVMVGDLRDNERGLTENRFGTVSVRSIYRITDSPYGDRFRTDFRWSPSLEFDSPLIQAKVPVQDQPVDRVLCDGGLAPLRTVKNGRDLLDSDG
jgi:hypothetical protein